MRTSLRIALVAGACAGFAALPRDRQDPLEKRVQTLETELQSVRAALDSTIGYLRENAKATAALGRVLDNSEKLGFTKGINPDSREVLLAGWREWIGTTQVALPVAPKKPKAVEANGKRK